MIQFIKYRFLFVLFSGALLTIGFIHILLYGFHYSIDFIGGTVAEFSSKNPIVINNARTFASKKKLSFLKTGGGVIIRGKTINRKLLEKSVRIKAVRFDAVSPSMSSDNVVKTLVAVGIAALGILIYITYSFKSAHYASAAVIAIFHDTGILLCAWSILGRWFGAEFDLLFVTALLTTMSFSVHDTIIIFDKIAEEHKNGTYKDLEETINAGLTLTIGRSLNNSFTVVIMLSAMIVLGGETIRWFAAALLLGTIFGTYSSPFIATPFYYFLKEGVLLRK